MSFETIKSNIYMFILNAVETSQLPDITLQNILSYLQDEQDSGRLVGFDHYLTDYELKLMLEFDDGNTNMSLPFVMAARVVNRLHRNAGVYGQLMIEGEDAYDPDYF